MSKITINVKNENNSERDFIENPIEIETETKGILPKERDTKQTALETAIEAVGVNAKNVQEAISEVLEVAKSSTNTEKQTASETPFASENFVAKDVQTALDEVFTLTDSNRKRIISAIGNPLINTSTYQEIINAITLGKTDISAAIVKKGTSASVAMGLSELASRISLIQTGDGGGSSDLKLTDEITATSNMPYEIAITPFLKPVQSVAQVYKHNAAGPVFVHYQNDFNNVDATSFEYDSAQINFDGMMKIKDKHEYVFTDISSYAETAEIDFSKIIEYGEDAVLKRNNMVLNGIKTTQAVAKANGDISLEETTEINAVTLTAVGVVRVAVSVDSGFTWQAFNGSTFTDLNITDLSSFKTNGMLMTTLNAVTKAQWTAYRGDSNTLRFAYFIERATFKDNSGTDAIKLDANIAAHWLPAQTSDYTQTFDATAQKYVFKFITAGKYKVRYKEG